MNTCWLCREPLTPDPELGDTTCNSCQVRVNPDGTRPMNSGANIAHAHVALARAVDRLTKQLADEAKERKLDEKFKRVFGK